MVTSHLVLESPVGPLTLRASDGVLSGLYMTDQRYRPAAETFGAEEPHALPEAREQLVAYFAGELTRFDVPLVLHGTDFQRRVWEALRAVPYGATTSYGELARAIGSPGASRAVGMANGRNPVGIIVPCHRVVGASGALTGYGGGLARKQALLDHERAELRFDLPLGPAAGPASRRSTPTVR